MMTVPSSRCRRYRRRPILRRQGPERTPKSVLLSIEGTVLSGCNCHRGRQGNCQQRPPRQWRRSDATTLHVVTPTRRTRHTNRLDLASRSKERKKQILLDSLRLTFQRFLFLSRFFLQLHTSLRFSRKFFCCVFSKNLRPTDKVPAPSQLLHRLKVVGGALRVIRCAPLCARASRRNLSKRERESACLFA